MDISQQKYWPALPYEDFQETGYFLHRCVQIIGKLKLHMPFEPQWSNIALWLTSRGLTTGPIPYQGETFTIDMDFFDHQILFSTSSGATENLKLGPMSVSDFTNQFFAVMRKLNIALTINFMPQEILDCIAFDQDTSLRAYNPTLAHTWWRILLSSYIVMQQYHSNFNGKTPPIGLMWGTFDLRDARYNGVAVAPTGINAEYIRRNAMDEAQIEIGWWSGNLQYPRAAYYSFTYPQPDKIEQAKIEPAQARWEKTLGEFILDYDDLRLTKNPAKELLAFFQSTYQVGSTLAGWNPKLIMQGPK